MNGELERVDVSRILNGRYFGECFRVRDNSYFLNMMRIVGRGFAGRSDGTYLERHHVVPKAWFALRGLKPDDSEGNVVYLTCGDRLKIQVLLYYYFGLVGDVEMVKRIVSQTRFMSKEGCRQLLRLGDISDEVLGEYGRRRTEAFRNGRGMHRRYTEDFMRRCFGLFSECDDPKTGYLNVKGKMDIGGIGSADSLVRRFGKYIPREELEAVLSRQRGRK